jgi:hypothetical protein
MDIKTRWNCLCDMLERFQTLQNCLIKTLSAWKSGNKFTDGELPLLSETTAALQPVKVAIEKLCSREIDLYSADNTFQFMLDEPGNGVL